MRNLSARESLSHLTVANLERRAAARREALQREADAAILVGRILSRRAEGQ